jgi:hypothetical protein
LAESLNQYFEYIDAKPEFFEQEFFTDRGKLVAHDQKNPKAIFLKGVSRRYKSIDLELEFLKMWKEREKSNKKAST